MSYVNGLSSSLTLPSGKRSLACIKSSFSESMFLASLANVLPLADPSSNDKLARLRRFDIDLSPFIYAFIAKIQPCQTFLDQSWLHLMPCRHRMIPFLFLIF